MAVVSKSPNTSTLAASAWRKFQAPVAKAIRWSVEEARWIKEMKDAKFVPTLREVLFPMMLTRSGGAASVPENSYKAIPRTANPQDGSATLIHMTSRFSVPYKGINIQNRDSRTYLLSQLKLGAMSSAETLAAQVGDYFYAPESAILAKTDTDLAGASTTLTLKDGLNQTWLQNAGYIAGRFRVGDKVAVYNGGTRVSNAVGTVTAVTAATPSIAVTWDGSAPSEATNDLTIVKANTMENSQDDRNNGIAGNLLDICTASTLHGLATSAAPEWTVAGTDTTGGRLTYVRLHKALDEIANTAPDPANALLIAQGVLRDMRQNYEGQLRGELGKKIVIDGDLDVGLTIRTSRRVPPGVAVVYDDDKWQLFDGKQALASEDGGFNSADDLYESEDTFQFLGDLNWIGNLVCRSRRSFYFFRSLTEQ
jgi:hypothetical protein